MFIQRNKTDIMKNKKKDLFYRKLMEIYCTEQTFFLLEVLLK